MKVSPNVIDAIVDRLPEIPRETIERVVETLFELALPPLADACAKLLSAIVQLDPDKLAELFELAGFGPAKGEVRA